MTLCFAVATRSVLTHNRGALQTLAVSNAERQLRWMVNGTCTRIEDQRKEVYEETEQLLTVTADSLKLIELKPTFADRIIDELFVLEYGREIQMLVDYEGAERIDLIYSHEGTQELSAEKTDALIEKVKKDSICRLVDKEDMQIYLFVKRADLEEIAKAHIYEEIHAATYESGRYIWVNEVLDYNGGEKYAIRRIHPNLKETEGMYLSTHTEDIAGNLPYQSELDGIVRNGDIFHSYYFKNLNDDQIAEKVSYAKLYKPYNWIVAAGEPLDAVYMALSEMERDDHIIVMRLLGVCLLAEIVLLIWILLLQKRYRKDINEYIKAETERDVLTGTLTRKAGQIFLEEQFRSFRERGGVYLLLMIDVDKFKGINDTYGHNAGDTVLREVARVIQSNIRETDRLIRWGGDEFILLCGNVNETAQSEIAAKVLRSVQNLRVEIEKGVLTLSLSIGFTTFSEKDRDYLETVSRADQALYHSKNNGKSRYTDYRDIVYLLEQDEKL